MTDYYRIYLPVLVGCASLLGSLFVGSHRAHAQALNESVSSARTIKVTGTASIDTVPDQAVVRFSVVTENENAETARAENAKASSAAMNLLRSLDIADSDLTLTALTLRPAREWDPETRRYNEMGFEVHRSVSVVLNDIDNVALVVARIVEAGANRLDGVTYGLSDDGNVRIEALMKAVVNARQKAEAMVGALGSKVGKVVEIREEGVLPPRPYATTMRAMTMEKSSADPSPDAYAPGTLEITARVIITFSIE